MPTEYENIELEKKERRQNFFFRKEKDYVEKVTLVHIVVWDEHAPSLHYTLLPESHIGSCNDKLRYLVMVLRWVVDPKSKDIKDESSAHRSTTID